MAGDEDGEEDDNVVEVGDGAFDLVDVVCPRSMCQQKRILWGAKLESKVNLHEDVTLFDGAFPGLQKGRDKTPKLPHKHLSFGVGDDVELILLLSDRR